MPNMPASTPEPNPSTSVAAVAQVTTSSTAASISHRSGDRRARRSPIPRGCDDCVGLRRVSPGASSVLPPRPWWRRGRRRVAGLAAPRRRRSGARRTPVAGPATPGWPGWARSTGTSLAVHRARRVFADAERRDELDTAFELKTAEQVAEALGQMKGAMMKLGQMASYLDQGLPEHVRDALAELQTDAPPMSPELAADDDPGRARAPIPTDVFAEWDPVPIAAASIGQVHRAITHDGHAVAVKVQYPGVEEAIGADLDNVGPALRRAWARSSPGLDPKPLVAELRDRLVEELDYRIEADNQQLFADYYEGHPTIHVPEVHRALLHRAGAHHRAGRRRQRSTRCTAWSQDERDLAAETIYRFVFGSLYRLHVFNGDPHPGNYLFRPGGQVTFLDFGLVKHFTDAEIDIFGVDDPGDGHRPRPGRVPRASSRTSACSGRACRSPTRRSSDYFGHFYDFVRRGRRVHDHPRVRLRDRAPLLRHRRARTARS